MKINLTTKLTNVIVTKVVNTIVKKKLGYNIDIQLNDVVITEADGKVHLHIDVDAETSTEEFKKIINDVI